MTDYGSLITVKPSHRCAEGIWTPVQGAAFTELLNNNTSLSTAEKERLSKDTFSILEKCVAPQGPSGKNTGLVIGYVQSGKTLSFTGLSALARDNNYRLIILLAGTTNNLVQQSFDRLQEDLGVQASRVWRLFTTQEKQFQNSELERLNTELAKWKRSSLRARTIVIVAMKQHQHLETLSSLLKDADLVDVPTLIIDDEGDQASMNTRAKQHEESTTYSRILALRDLFPHHSYILYTATPQAPLLISRIDTLSPDFGRVLTPGEGYVGGMDFFIKGADKYIQLIPAGDVPDRENLPAEPPQSLLAALRAFFCGVAIGLLVGDDQRGKNRSMMIHPAVPRDEHLMFKRWVRNIKQDWTDILKDANNAGHDDLIERFRESADDLFSTFKTDLTFEDLRGVLFEAIEETAIEELNTREKSRIPSVDWTADYSWILIGGIGLDRGFTIEGLTVSYMPRSTGVGNADNIQQRARFFGYKKDYLGLCRIFLTSDNINAFTSYVKHEEDVRRSIQQHLNTGKTLKQWRREYQLDPNLKPTRSSVVMLEMYQSKGKGGMIFPLHPFEDAGVVADNRAIAEDIIASFSWWEYAEDGWNDKQRIPAFNDKLKLPEIRDKIAQMRYKLPEDNYQHFALLASIDRLISGNEDMQCCFYCFSGPWSGVSSSRSLTEGNPPKIKNLFQGANEKTNYPGARALVSAENITFQLHRYDIFTSDKKRVIRDVPILVAHIPSLLSKKVWIER